jgi:hypothetical protein
MMLPSLIIVGGMPQGWKWLNEVVERCLVYLEMFSISSNQ